MSDRMGTFYEERLVIILHISLHSPPKTQLWLGPGEGLRGLNVL